MPGSLYDLCSKWVLAANTSEVWNVIADPDMSWPSWWPHCTFAGPLAREESHDKTPAGILLATTAKLNFKAILGYTLTISVHPTLVETPRVIEFDAGGHLEGSGRVTLTARPDASTNMGIEWRVRPTQRWMNALTPLAAPAFTAAHAHLMSQGEKGLRAALARAMR